MNDKLKLLMSLSIILICLGLSVKMIIESQQYSCNQCEIHFKSARFLSNDFRLLNYPITYLFDRYEAGYCAVSWDYNQGYTTMEMKR